MITIGSKVRMFGTGKLARRTTPVTVKDYDGKRSVTVEFNSGNVATVDISRIKR